MNLHWIWAYKNTLYGSLDTYLSESIAEPSSNISSTILTEDSFFDSLLAESFDFFLKMKDLNLFVFLGGDGGGSEWSGWAMSTTMQVVSSFKPLVLSASCLVITQDKQVEN